MKPCVKTNRGLETNLRICGVRKYFHTHKGLCDTPYLFTVPVC